VAQVGLAWLDLGCRLTCGTPLCAVCSQRTLPVFLSRHSTLKSIGESIGYDFSAALPKPPEEPGKKS